MKNDRIGGHQTHTTQNCLRKFFKLKGDESVLDKLAVSEDADTKLAESAYGEAMSDILLRQAVGIDVIAQNML